MLSNIVPRSCRCRVGLLSCAAVMKPLYKQEMYTLKVNSTRNFNTVRYHFLCSFALYVLVLVPPAFKSLKLSQKAV